MNEKSTRFRNTVRLINSMKPYRGEMLLTMISAILRHMSAIGAAVTVSYGAALAMQGGISGHIKPMFAILVICILLRALLYYGEMLLGHDVAYKVLRDLRIRMYDKIEEISPAFLIRRHSGQLGATLMGDIELLEWFLAHTVGSMVVALFTMILIVTVLSVMSPALGIITTAFAAAVFATPFLLRRTADRQGRDVRESLAKANTTLIEGIQGQKEILTLKYRDGYEEKLNAVMTGVYTAQKRYGIRVGVESSMMQVLIGIYMITMMLVSAGLVTGGKLDLSLFPVILTLSALLLSPITEVCAFARNLGNVFAAADRVQRVFDESPAVTNTGEEEIEGRKQREIRFENVSFRYREDMPDALSDVSFTVRPGETVALVGHSGAGKSTCIKLLLRYWDVDSGRILIDGWDIRDIPLQTLRDTIGAVLQEVYLFNNSIADNIRLGKNDAVDEEVKEAAKKAYAGEFIDGLPDGYDTTAGESGAKFSGGQKQRISIARAILKDPQILILDEAVSSLDTENEHLIQTALKEQSRDRTTLIVAHRLSTIMEADKVVLLQNGKVCGIGTHSKLLKENNVYRELINKQS